MSGFSHGLPVCRGLCRLAAVLVIATSGVFVAPVQRTHSATLEPEMMQGVEALPRGKFPWQARLVDGSGALANEPANRAGLFCGGVLINPQYVLTAAHCLWYVSLVNDTVLDRRNRPIFVILGDHQRSVEEGVEQVIRVSQAILHPGYTDPSTGFYDQPDLALLKLSTPANITDRVRPILWLTREEEDIYMPVDAAGTISGWGLFDAAQKTSDPLRETTLYVSGLTATHVTFTSTTHMSCPGDSGGPFVVDVNGTPKLAGVISWALGNTRVAPQDAWLQTVIYGPAPLWASARLSRVFIPLTVTR